MATVTLRLTPQRAHVRTARLVAAAMARRSGVSEELLDEIRLAVGEACARAVQLHERGGIAEPVVVTLIDDNRFEIIVQDVAPPTGTSGDPTANPGNSGNPTDAANHANHANHRNSGHPANPAEPTSPGDAGDAGDGSRPSTIRALPDDDAANHRAGGADRSGSTRAWEEPLDTGLGLALLAALVEDITVEMAGSLPGTRVRMSWPIDRASPDGDSGRMPPARPAEAPTRPAGPHRPAG